MWVSIIIPIYKVADYIKDCLMSVLAQTYKEIEVVLVDDYTPDNSMQIATPIIELLKQKFEVQVLQHERNLGLSAARNTGVSAATGEYIYFLDSDDELTKDCIELLVNRAMEYPAANFVIGGVKVEGSNYRYPLNMPNYCTEKTEIIDGFATTRWYVMAVNKLIKLSFFTENNLWFVDGLLHEDELFSFHLAFSAQSMCCVNTNTYIYKVRNQGSITSQQKLVNFEHRLKINTLKFEWIRKNIPTATELPVWRIVLDSTYLYIMITAVSSRLSRVEKKRLAKKMISDYRTMKQYQSSESWTQKMKATFLCLPISILMLLLKIHFRMKPI